MVCMQPLSLCSSDVIYLNFLNSNPHTHKGLVLDWGASGLVKLIRCGTPLRRIQMGTSEHHVCGGCGKGQRTQHKQTDVNNYGNFGNHNRNKVIARERPLDDFGSLNH